MCLDMTSALGEASCFGAYMTVWPGVRVKLKESVQGVRETLSGTVGWYQLWA